MADSSELPTIVPMLSYEDVARAIEWLTRAFGFREIENERYTEPDGRVSHAELRLGGGTIMLGSPSPHYEGPRRHAESCEAARRWREPGYVVDGVHVLVEDVDQCQAAIADGQEKAASMAPARNTPAVVAATSWATCPDVSRTRSVDNVRPRAA